MKGYILVSSVVMLGLGLIWKKEDALNFVIKLGLFGLGVWGLVERFAP